jgi:SNF2 family DNA or RNA helicase
MATLKRENGQLALNLKGHPDFMGALEVTKSIPGRRFDPDTKDWVFPEDPAVAERILGTIKPEASPELLTWVREHKNSKHKDLVTELPEDADLQIPWAHKRAPWQPETVGKSKSKLNGLYSYQRAFIDHAASKKNPAMILADSPGLGKTSMSSGTVIEWLLRQTGIDINSLNPPLESFTSVDHLLTYAGVENNGPKLIVAPNSVKGTWERELRMWLGEDTPIALIDATTPKARNKQLKEGIEKNAWVIVNWEQLRTKKEEKTRKVRIINKLNGELVRIQDKKYTETVMREPLFESTKWTAVIADEAHRAKNRKSLSAQGLWRVQGDVKLALTGTPILNSPDEIWSILRWLYPEQYGNSTPTMKKTPYWPFYDEYVDYYEGQFGKIITGVKNPDKLRFELKDRVVRRTKGEVLDLPEKTRVFVPVQMSKEQRKLYDEAERQVWFEVEQAAKEGDKNAQRLAEKALKNPSALYEVPNGAARMVRLRQIASSPALLGGEDVSAKMDTAVDMVLDSDGQWIWFTEFVGSTHVLVERLKKKGLRAEAYTGEVSSIDRTRLENEFQAGDIDVIVGTIAAMREGITLTAASDVGFLERHWTPSYNEQAEDRSHRVGQDSPVTIWILEAINSVDTNNVRPTNNIKQLIVGSVINQDTINERAHEQ